MATAINKALKHSKVETTHW